MFNTTRTLVSLLRELNLNELDKAAERPVRVAVVGDAGVAGEVAAHLGETPWASALADPNDRRPSDVIIRVSRGAPPDEPLPEGALEVVVAPTGDTPPKRVDLISLSEEEVSAKLAPALLEHAPEETRLALARHLPVLRKAYAAQLIEETSRANAVYAATTGVASLVPLLSLPLGVADTMVLTKNQLMMAYKLALAEGKKGEPQALMKEIISVVGGAFLFRQVARQLVGLIPAWGLVPKVAVAFAGTWVIGRTVHVWASRGEEAAMKEMQRAYKEAFQRGRTVAESLVSRLRQSRRGRAHTTGPQRKLPPPAEPPETER
jgi:uncharacterized protein (DUF697 family)